MTDASPPSSPRKPWEAPATADYSAASSCRPHATSTSTAVVAPAVAATPDEQVATAVRFLRNPKVATAPLATKRAFLTQKGLSDAQIDEALRRVGASEADAPPTTPTPLPPAADRRRPGASRPALARLGRRRLGRRRRTRRAARRRRAGRLAERAAARQGRGGGDAGACGEADEAAAPAPADACRAPSPAAQRVEESLARLRRLQKPAVSTAALEAALAAPLEAHSAAHVYDDRGAADQVPGRPPLPPDQHRVQRQLQAARGVGRDARRPRRARLRRVRRRAPTGSGRRRAAAARARRTSRSGRRRARACRRGSTISSRWGFLAHRLRAKHSYSNSSRVS